MTADEWVAKRSKTGPVLVRGRLLSFRLYRWRSTDDFTALVTMNLRFRGDPVAWGQGVNTRFVSFRRHSPTDSFRLYLATGP